MERHRCPLVGSIQSQGVQGFFSGAGTWLWNAGSSIMTGFLGGLKSMWSAVTSFVSGIGAWIAANKGPIEVDAKLLTPHGEAIMSGLVDGMRNGMPDLDRQLAAITGQIRGVGGDGAALNVSAAYGGGGAAGAGGGGGVTVHVHVAGTVLAERDLATTVQQALLRNGTRNTGAGITYAFGSGR